MVYHKRNTIPSEFTLKPLTQNEISRAQHFLKHNSDGIHIVEVNEARSELSRVKIWIEMQAGFTIRGMLTGEIIDENDVECLDYIYFPKAAKQASFFFEQRMNQLLKKDWCIPIWQLEDVRPGKESPSFRKHWRMMEEYTISNEKYRGFLSDGHCMSLFFGTHCDFTLTHSYGKAFHWHNRSFLFENPKDCAEWTNACKYVMFLWHKSTSLERRILHQDTWYWALKDSETFLNLNTFSKRNCLERLNCDNTNKKVRQIITEFEKRVSSRDESGEISQPEFRNLLDTLAFQKQPLVAKYILDNYGLNMTNEEDPIDVNWVKLFLVDVNSENWVNNLDHQKLFDDFLRDCFGTDENVNSQTFLDFLFSDENSIQKPEITYGHNENFKSSMVDYQINSSHNTYLVSDQLWGLSSIEAYIKALRMGCRCVELDTWNGNDPKFGRGLAHNKDEIVILHGWTITTTILFKDVLVAIRDHAFAVSDLPVILSIENHCTNKNDSNGLMQDKMSRYFKEIFGDLLLMEEVAPENENGELVDRLPSPHSLRNKIIVKYKKNPEQWRRNGGTLSRLDSYWESSTVESESNSTHQQLDNSESFYSSIDDPETLVDETEIAVRSALFDKHDLKNSETEMKSFYRKWTNSRSSSVTSYGNLMRTTSDCMIDLVENDSGNNSIVPSKELDSCVIYCISNKFSKLVKLKQDEIDVRYMSSLAYSAIEKLISKRKMRMKLLEFSANRFIRNYPPGVHTLSANYNPIDCWNIGAQMVALNFQNADRFLTYSHAKFNCNNGHGFLKKPEYMLNKLKGEAPAYEGKDDDKNPIVIPWTEFEITILGARNIPRHMEIDGVSFPDIKIEVVGPNNTSYTKTKEGKDCGGFSLQMENPVNFPKTRIRYFRDSYLYIELSEKGIYGTRIRVGQATVQLAHIRPGIRSIPLCDKYNQTHALASLLVDVRYVEELPPQLPRSETINMRKNKAKYLQNWLEELTPSKSNIEMVRRLSSNKPSATTTSSGTTSSGSKMSTSLLFRSKKKK